MRLSKEEKQRRQVASVPRRELYPSGEAAILLCCSWKFLQLLMSTGKLRYVVRNKARLVSQQAINDYIKLEEANNDQAVDG